LSHQSNYITSGPSIFVDIFHCRHLDLRDGPLLAVLVLYKSIPLVLIGFKPNYTTHLRIAVHPASLFREFSFYALPWNVVLPSLALYCTTLYYTALYYTTLYYTDYTTLHCSIVHFTALHYFIVHFTTLH
jgi:hypothetical protein